MYSHIYLRKNKKNKNFSSHIKKEVFFFNTILNRENKRKMSIPNWLVMINFFGGSLIFGAIVANRWGVIMVLLINFTVGYALKYAAKPPVFFVCFFFFHFNRKKVFCIR